VITSEIDSKENLEGCFEQWPKTGLAL